MNFKRNKGWLFVVLCVLYSHHAQTGVGSATIKTLATLVGLGSIAVMGVEQLKQPDYSFIVKEIGFLTFATYKMFFEKQPEPSTLFTDVQLKNIESFTGIPSCVTSTKI